MRWNTQKAQIAQRSEYVCWLIYQPGLVGTVNSAIILTRIR